MQLSRREFLAAAMGAGALVAVPIAFEPLLGAAKAAVPGGPGFFLTAAELTTLRAIAARIVPAGEADAGAFVDRFLAAFELPATVADGPAIWIRGRYSGRQPFPASSTGQPSATFPPSDFQTGAVTHFVSLSPAQELSWRIQLYGSKAIEQSTLPIAAKWKAQLGEVVGLRDRYRAGLAAFDTYARSAFLAPFASCSAAQQDVLLLAAGNVVIDALPLPLPAPLPPQAAKDLVPIVSVHTYQATYGLAEYAGRAQANPSWKRIGWDGDTQPLGNSVYDDVTCGPGEGPNAGFGDPAVYQPRGALREHRPVSYLGPQDRKIGAAQLAQVTKAVEFLKKARP